VRIIMVSPYDLSVPGGVQGQVTGLTAALRTLGHDVVVLAPGRPGSEDAAGVRRLGRAFGVRANGSVAPVTLSPWAAVRAGAAVRDPGIDVVHIHEPLAPVLPYGCLVASRHPIVGTFHRNGSSPLYRAMAPAVRWVARRLAARCAVSESARDNVAPTSRAEFEVLFNGIDIDRYAHAAPAARTGPTVLFVGRHERRKGLGVLLEAWTRVETPATLWIVGEGPETDELRGRFAASAHLEWLGAISEGEKAARLAAADVFCAPSVGGESFGVVLLEAMAARCALLASDIDGYRAAAGTHARLVPPGDSGALAVAIDEMLGDAAAGAGRSGVDALDAAFRHAERWSMQRLAMRYVEIYERVLADPPARATPGPQVA